MSQGGKEKRKREREEKKATSSHPHPPLLSFLVYVPDISPLFPSLLSAECVPSIQKINTLNHKKPTSYVARNDIFAFSGKALWKVAKLFFIFPSSLFASESQMLLRRNNRTPFGSPSLIHYRKRERGKKGRHHLSAPLRTFGGLVFWAGERKRMSSRRMRRWRRLFPSLVRIRIARAEEEEEEEGRETCQ